MCSEAYPLAAQEQKQVQHLQLLTVVEAGWETNAQFSVLNQ